MVRRTRFVLFLFLFFISRIALSDIITLSDGKRVRGRILNSTKNYVAMVTEDSQTIQIPHDKIKSIHFSWADVVHLTSGEKIKCKIVNRVPPNLLVITEDGLQKIPLENLAMYFYHSAEALDVSGLPVTGLDFKNQKEFPLEDTRTNFYLEIKAGTHRPPYNRWKQDFMGASWDFSGGAGAGYYLTKWLALDGGIEYSLYRFTHYEDLESKYHTYYIYGGLEFSKQIVKSAAVYLFLGADVGYFNAQGNIYLFSFRKIEFNENALAFNPRAGVYTSINRQFSLSLEIGYFIAKVGPIEIPVENTDNPEINFNGISAFLRLLYHI